jgi:hypothetical protein
MLHFVDFVFVEERGKKRKFTGRGDLLDSEGRIHGSDSESDWLPLPSTSIPKSFSLSALVHSRLLPSYCPISPQDIQLSFSAIVPAPTKTFIPYRTLNNPLPFQSPNNQKNYNKKCCPEQRAEAGAAEKAVIHAATLVGGTWWVVVDGEA